MNNDKQSREGADLLLVDGGVPVTSATDGAVPRMVGYIVTLEIWRCFLYPRHLSPHKSGHKKRSSRIPTSSRHE